MPAAELALFPLHPSLTPSSAAPLLHSLAQHPASFPGFMSAHCGPCAEDAKIYCLVLEWEDEDRLEGWVRGHDQERVRKEVGGLVDGCAGLEGFVVFVKFQSGTEGAFRAPVTALRFCGLPDEKANEGFVMKRIANKKKSVPIDQNSGEIVKPKGLAEGFIWVSKPEPADLGSSLCHLEISGFESVEEHWEWRGKELKDMRAENGVFKAIDVLGKRRSTVPGSGVLHVELKKIA